jgi:hypothetical protein
MTNEESRNTSQQIPRSPWIMRVPYLAHETPVRGPTLNQRTQFARSHPDILRSIKILTYRLYPVVSRTLPCRLPNQNFPHFHPPPPGPCPITQ